MALNYVSLVFTEQDAGNSPAGGAVTIAPTSAVVAAGVTVVSALPVSRQLSSGTISVSLVATDNAGTTPAAGFWAYTITLPGGSPQTYLLPFSGGATQQFSNLTPAVALTAYSSSIVPGAYALLAGATFTGFVAPAVVTLTFGASIAVNAALGNAFNLTLTASTGTLANPANPVDGQVIRVRVTQGGAGSFTLAYGTAYDFGAAGAPTLSTAVGKVDVLGFEYVASLAKWCYLGSALGN